MKEGRRRKEIHNRTKRVAINLKDALRDEEHPTATLGPDPVPTRIMPLPYSPPLCSCELSAEQMRTQYFGAG
jgi:hypothetical protein